MVSIVVVRRVKPIPYFIVPISALAAGIAVSIVILFFLTGGMVTPMDVLYSIWAGLSQPYVIAYIFIILTVIGFALVLSFKGGIYNIGGEGQFWIATWVVVWLVFTQPFIESLNQDISKLLLLLAGFISGFAWALVAGAIRGYIGVDEVPLTLMMNYIAYYLIDWFVMIPGKPWRDIYGYAKTRSLPSSLQYPIIPALNVSIELIAILLGVGLIVWFILDYTKLGLAIKIHGSNPRLLRSAGYNVPLIAMLTLAISGGFIGIAGVGYLCGVTPSIRVPVETSTSGFGYIGILVTWLSMLELYAVPIAAYVVSSLYNAGTTLMAMKGMQQAGITAGVTNVFIGSVLLMYALLITMSEYEIKIVA
ncbi:ABC transporter permease [Thermogladius sp. 4427co]|uniref:ABC transporter permease n=1 Tax=Thermogladius sp. 4427co TaxID=3450718 RepID=UPI003F798449